MQILEKQHTDRLSPETVTRRVLDNGMTVVVYPNPTIPTLVARVAIKGGAMYDPSDKAGLASFTARAMRRGTESHTFEQLNEETESRAVSVGLDAGKALMDTGGRALKEDTDFLLGTIAELVLTPSFPAGEIEKLRAQLRAGLKEMETDTGSVAERAFRETLYPEGHPYHNRTAGFLETVDNISREDMLAFYTRYFRPDRALLFVVGDVEAEEIVAKAQELFGGWRAGDGEPEPYTVPDVAPPQGAHNIYKFVSGKTQNDIVLGFPGLRRTDPDYYAFDLMNLLLGRIGLMGRLGKNVRDDQGLAYHAGSSFEAGLGAGPWAVRAGVNPSSVLRAIESIRHEIERIRTEPISPEELEGGKRYMTGVMPLRLETSNGLLGALSEIELFGLGYDYISRYSDIIWALTPQIVGEVAKRRLSSQDYVVSVAGPPVEGLVSE
ncbi:MAG TPA: pitrilysin family protein [Chloroflexia bacterium]|nr:pitrilysin family protein [Chloroflexia bacterium]